MAPKPRSPPLSTSAAASSASPPTPSQRGKVKPSQRGPKESSRGGESQRGGARKKNLSTAEKLEKREEAKKAKDKQIMAAIEEKERAPALPEVALDDLEDLKALTGPTESLVAELRARLVELEARKAELRPLPPMMATLTAGDSPTVASMADAKYGRVWKGLAEEKLAEMASSLEGALLNDAKLRELFDHIDLDKSGTIEPAELKAALAGAGKALPPEQIDEMLQEARAGCGDDAITLQGFGYILKGVKAATAATVIERRAREHVTRKKEKKKQPVTASQPRGDLDRK